MYRYEEDPRAKALGRMMAYLVPSHERLPKDPMRKQAEALLNDPSAREGLDDIIVGTLAPIGCDPRGVRSWLSKMDDSDLALAILQTDRKYPSSSDAQTLMHTHCAARFFPVFSMALALVDFERSDHAAILPGVDVRYVAWAKEMNADAAIVCRHWEDQAALALWLHFERVPFSRKDFAMESEAGIYASAIAGSEAGNDIGMITRHLAEGGRFVVSINSGDLHKKRFELDRRALVASGLLEAAVFVIYRMGLLLLSKNEASSDYVYIAKTCGRGARAVIPAISHFETSGPHIAEAIREHVPIPCVGSDVQRSAVLDDPTASLILDSYRSTGDHMSMDDYSNMLRILHACNRDLYARHPLCYQPKGDAV